MSDPLRGPRSGLGRRTTNAGAPPALPLPSDTPEAVILASPDFFSLFVLPLGGEFFFFVFHI